MHNAYARTQQTPARAGGSAAEVRAALLQALPAELHEPKYAAQLQLFVMAQEQLAGAQVSEVAAWVLARACEHTCMIRRPLLQHCDALPSPVAAVALLALGKLLAVYDPFVRVWLMRGQRAAMGMYARKLVARLMRERGLPVEEGAPLLRGFQTASELRAAAAVVRADTTLPAMRLAWDDGGLTIGPPAAVLPEVVPEGRPLLDCVAEVCSLSPVQLAALLQPVQPATPGAPAVKVVLGGGAAVSASLKSIYGGHEGVARDLDLYLIGAAIKEVFADAALQLVARVIELFDGGVLWASSQALSGNFGSITVQVSMRRFPTVLDVLLSYDMDAACAATDGTTLWLTEGALHAHAHRAGTLDPWQATRPQRALKYARNKHVSLAFPVRTADPLCQALHEELERRSRWYRSRRIDGWVSVKDRTWARSFFLESWNIAQPMVLAMLPSALSHDVLSSLLPDDSDSFGVLWSARAPELPPQVHVDGQQLDGRALLSLHGWTTAKLLDCWSTHAASRVLAANPFDRSNYCSADVHLYSMGRRALQEVAYLSRERVLTMRDDMRALVEAHECELAALREQLVGSSKLAH